MIPMLHTSAANTLPVDAKAPPYVSDRTASIKAEGSRLTELASSSGLSLSAMSELVDSLEGFGYLERAPDPSDGRAKIVCLTDSGWQAIRKGRLLIDAIEADWANALESGRFEALCLGLQDLLNQLDPSVREEYASPPPESC